MALTDSPSLRQLLTHLFPGIVIQENLRPSGQRLVYFCRFRSEPTAPVHWQEWGVRIPRDGEQCFHGIVNTDSTAT
jgi:hypothetical protein